MVTYISGGQVLEWGVLEVAPATGSTTSFPLNYNAVFFTSNSTTAAQTLNMPLTPTPGDMANISNAGAITALTLVPAVAGAPAGLTAGQGLQVRYSSTLPGWYVFS
jgi:hypothetical protein